GGVVSELQGQRVVALVEGQRTISHLDVERLVPLVDRLAAVSLGYGGRVIAFGNRRGAIVLDGTGLIMSDIQRVVILDLTLKILFGVEDNLLRALLVLERQLVGIGCRAGKRAA